MRSLDDLFLVWLLASMIAALLPVPRAPMMWGFGMLVWPCPTLPRSVGGPPGVVVANAMLGIP